MSENSREPDIIFKFTLLYILLAVFALWWKAPTLLLFTLLITLILFLGGYSRTITAATQILVRQLEKYGAAKEVVEEILKDMCTSDSKEEVRYVPIDTNQRIKLKTSSILKEYINKAESSLQKRDIESAIKYLKSAIETDTENWYAYHLLGAIYLMKKEHDLALRYLIKAMRLDGAHFNQFMNAGVAYLNLKEKENDEAITCLIRSTEIIEQDRTARHLPRFVLEYGKSYLFIGEAYENLKNKEKAKEYILKSIAKFKEIPKQYRDDAIKYWMKEAQNRLKKFGS